MFFVLEEEGLVLVGLAAAISGSIGSSSADFCCVLTTLSALCSALYVQHLV